MSVLRHEAGLRVGAIHLLWVTGVDPSTLGIFEYWIV